MGVLWGMRLARELLTTVRAVVTASDSEADGEDGGDDEFGFGGVAASPKSRVKQYMDLIEMLDED